MNQIPSEPKTVDVGGIAITPFPSTQSIIQAMFSRQSQQIPTMAIAINPEKIMLARKDNKIKEILESSHIRYADGIGVVKAIKYKHGLTIPRLPGCELWESLMQEGGKRNSKVFIIGASQETLAATCEKLKDVYDVNIVGQHDGYFSNKEEIIEKVIFSKADIVSVALGSPKQERFIMDCIQAGSTSIFMGVGGTYDVFTGKVKRAPAFWRKMNLEWLYRLLSQPTRWKRQVNLLKFFCLMSLRKL